MIRVGRTPVAGLVLAVGLGLGAAQPALATSGNTFIDSQWEEIASMSIDHLGSGCPAFVGTLAEDLVGRDTGVISPDGVAHVRTRATSTITLTPADPASVAYTGSYAMDQTGTYVETSDGTSELTRTVHGTMTVGDGSIFQIVEVVHVNVDVRGQTRASFDHFRCG